MDNQNNRTAIIVAAIGIVTTIITGFFSYKVGTAQVEIPIMATQTAEAKQTPTISAVNDTGNLGSFVNSDNWSAKLLDSGVLKDFSSSITELDNAGSPVKVVEVLNAELTSSRDSAGFTSPLQSLRFAWLNPIHDKPYSGIIAQLYVKPNSGDENLKMFCYFVADYKVSDNLSVPYTSSGKFISYDDWNTLVWDFTGTIYVTGTSWETNWKSLASELSSQGHFFASPSVRLGEQLLYNNVIATFKGGDSNWRERLKSINLDCHVTTNSDYTEVTAASFRGTFYLGNVFVQPVDYPGLK